MINTAAAASVEEEKKEDEKPNVAPLSVTEKAMICLNEIQDSDIRLPD